MNYDVTYFINKFEAIPECDMGSGDLESKCAYWHCGLLSDNIDEAVALSDLVHPLRPSQQKNAYHPNLSWSVIDINDGFDKRYKQPTPKQRILAALYDIKAQTRKDATAHLLQTPVVEEKLDVVGEIKLNALAANQP